MSIERWDPFREMVALRDSLNRLFDETLIRPGSDWLAGIRERPAVNVYETDSTVVVEAHLPGIKRDDVEITLSGATLTIKGERHSSEEVKDEHFLRREVHEGLFVRRVGLPEIAELDKAEASFVDGVLKITFPKRAEPQAKRIELTPESVPA